MSRFAIQRLDFVPIAVDDECEKLTTLEREVLLEPPLLFICLVFSCTDETQNV